MAQLPLQHVRQLDMVSRPVEVDIKTATRKSNMIYIGAFLGHQCQYGGAASGRSSVVLLVRFFDV